jgi:transcription termination factor NusB
MGMATPEVEVTEEEAYEWWHEKYGTTKETWDKLTPEQKQYAINLVRGVKKRQAQMSKIIEKRLPKIKERKETFALLRGEVKK